MSWQIAVTHRTASRYAQEVSSSYNEARITPLTMARQRCLESHIEVEPATRSFSYWDYWGTSVYVFDLHVAHTELVVECRSVVETSPSSPAAASVSWAELAAPGTRDRFAELLAPTAYVPDGHHELQSVVESLRALPLPAQAARGAADWVRDRLVYQPGATDVMTSAAEALQRGQGVCQDFAHLCLALLRALGIPARYASGYLHPNADAAVGETIEGQGHAWVDWWCGDWVPWDPTHGVAVGERHVLVARGRDYADVAPLKGIYQGAPVVEHNVAVQLTRLG